MNILERFSSSQGQYDGESDSDSQDEETEDSLKAKLSELGSLKTERSTEDSLDGEDYHPIMAVECILDNSEGKGEDGVQKMSEAPEQWRSQMSFVRGKLCFLDSP